MMKNIKVYLTVQMLILVASFLVAEYSINSVLAQNDGLQNLDRGKLFSRAVKDENLLTTPIINEIQEITSDDGEADDRFGWSLAIDGDTAVVGAYLNDHIASGSGAAYVFVKNGITWTQQAKLTVSDTAANRWFGYAVAISGETIAVGGRDTYIFTRSGTTWTEQARLPDIGNNEFSVAIDGDTVVVGESRDGLDVGIAYVYTRSGITWTEQAILIASDGENGDQFGISVSIEGDTIVIGAYHDDDNGANSGSAYIFTRSGTIWTEQMKLTADDGEASDEFGRSVSISGDTVIIGARNDDDNITNSGSAYVYTRIGTTWSEQAKLTASDFVPSAFFGVSVAIDGDRAVIGANNTFENGSGSGSAYIFTRSGTTWTEHRKLLASNGAAGDALGRSVAINGTTAIIGAYAKDIAASPFTDYSKGKISNLAGADQGAAYFFNFLAPTAASATISGRVLSPNGRGISRATVHLTDQNGNIKIAITNHFGHFRFENIGVGQSLILNVYHKKYQFNTQVVNFEDDLTDLKFFPQ